MDLLNSLHRATRNDGMPATARMLISAELVLPRSAILEE